MTYQDILEMLLQIDGSLDEHYDSELKYTINRAIEETHENIEGQNKINERFI